MSPIAADEDEDRRARIAGSNSFSSFPFFRLFICVRLRHLRFLLLVLLFCLFSGPGLLPQRRLAAAEKATLPAEEKPPQKPANRLAKETSPYLLLHAHNPVDWYPWGEEALAKARREKKLIFLSVGYSSCYWCHVMERESFMDDEVAAALNRSFVCIKVDREERPDVDLVYMAALDVYSRLANGHGGGGWPMSLFLTPDAKPVFGATYLPPRDKDGMEGLLTVVKRVEQAWSADSEKVQKIGDKLADIVQESLNERPNVALVELDATLGDDVQRVLAGKYDREYGGFDYIGADVRQSKFPQASKLAFLLHRARSADGDQAAAAKKMLFFTLEKMADGGIRDHLGGGFHRYSTDRYWGIPHFEKMLYDNGQLASVYAEAYALSPRADFKRVVDELLEFVGRELSDKQGGFYSALDAETDGQEGAFYVWQRDEVRKLLTPDEFSRFDKIYGPAGDPNFDGKYVPMLAQSPGKTAHERKLTEAALEQRLAPIRQKLLAVRLRRKHPLCDTKILTGWNGLMIRGYADAGRVFKNDQYVARAARAAEFVLSRLRGADGRLLHDYAGGEAKLPGYLDDYAFFVDGLIALHRATGDARWLTAADQLTAGQIELFWNERAGGFFYTSSEHESLIGRSRPIHDSAIPSGNSVSAANLVYLARAAHKPEYLDRAEKTILSVAGFMKQFPAVAPRMAIAFDQLSDARTETRKAQPTKPAP